MISFAALAAFAAAVFINAKPADGTEIKMGGHRLAITSLAFSPDGAMLASASMDGSVKIWDPKTGKKIQEIYPEETVINSVAFSPDGKYLAWGSDDKTIKVWDVVQNRGRVIMRGHTGKVKAVAFNKTGLKMASVSSDKKPVKDPVRLWHTATGDCLGVLEGHSDGALSLDYSPDGKLLATGGSKNDGTVHLWDPEEKRFIDRFVAHGTFVTGVKFSPAGRYLATCSFDSYVRIWDLERDNRRRHNMRHPYPVAGVAYSPDGKVLASACYDQNVYLWDTYRGRKIATLKGHSKNVLTVAYSKDGKLASGGWDKNIKIWNPELQECVLTIIK